MAKITVDLNEKAVSFERDKEGNRKPLFDDRPNANVGWCLNYYILAPCRDQPPAKIIGWIFEIDDNGKLEGMDETDFDLLKKIIEDDRNTGALIKGQILAAMKKSKDAVEKA